MPDRIEQLMAEPWKYLIEADREGGFRLTVPPLTDFELFADSDEELKATWQQGLRSHLKGYIAYGKRIPRPTPQIIEMTEGTAGGPASSSFNSRYEPVEA